MRRDTTRLPFAPLLSLSGPILVSLLSQLAMSVVTTLVVAPLGSTALAVVGVCGITLFSIVSFPLGLFRGVKTLVAQARGAGDPDGGSVYLVAGYAWVGLAGVTCMLLGVGASLWLPRLMASPASAEGVRMFLQIRCLGFMPALLCALLKEVRFARGDTRTPTVASLVGNGFNAGLDWLLVWGLGFGVIGAAWAGVAAQTLEALFLLGWLRRDLGRPRFERARFWAVWRVGSPAGIQGTLEVGSFLLLTLLLARLGDAEVSAHQLMFQLTQVALMPAIAVGEASVILAGEQVGRRSIRGVLRVAHGALRLVLACSVVIAAALLLFGRPLLGLLTPDLTLIDRAAALLVPAAAVQLLSNLQIVSRGVLRGVGDVRFPATVGVLCSWVLVLPVAWALGEALGLGSRGVWLALALESALVAALLWSRFGSLAWRRQARTLRQAERRAAKA